MDGSPVFLLYQSWIEIKNTVHTSVIGDRTHSQTKDIYAILEKLSRDAGYVPIKDTLLYDVEDYNGLLWMCSTANFWRGH